MNRQLPDEFVARMTACGLDDVVNALATTSPSVSVRVNRAKGVEVPAGAAAVPWNRDGYYLDERPAFTFDPAFHQGLYYVQDASSMAVGAAVRTAADIIGTQQPLRYLDACAAPGGKTTAAMDVLPDDTFVVANEFDPRRTAILVENIAKWGRPAVATRGDASQIKGLEGFFDIITADMPCSGEGMMRKEQVAVEQWSQALVRECAERQRAIAGCLWNCLAPGGVLVYSTCTFNIAENEEIVQWLIDQYGAEPIAVPVLDGIPEISSALTPYNFPAYRFMPGRTRGEGLFMAVLRKDGAPRPQRLKPMKIKPWAPPAQYLAGDWTYFLENNTVYALPSSMLPLLSPVAKAMNIVAPGIEIGELKGKLLVPAQALAMACRLSPEAFPRHEVDEATALAYLRREAVAVPDAPVGIVLLTRDGHPLGFVKNLGNRANNLYPQHWRIRSAVN